MICQEGMPNSPLPSSNSASLQFHWLQLLYIHFTQGKTERLSGPTKLTGLPVSLFLSQNTKKTLPRKVTIHPMTALVQLCESKCCSTLCKYLLEVWSNHFFLLWIWNSKKHKVKLTWCLFLIVCLVLGGFSSKLFENEGSLGQKAGEVWQALLKYV